MSVIGAIGRMIWVPIAFLVALVTAIFVLFTLGLEKLTHDVSGRAFDVDPFPILIDIVTQAGLLATGLTIIPALLVVLLGEVARIRSFLFYIVGGGLSLSAIPLLAQAGGTMTMPAMGVWQVFATAGFAGGFVYWLLAGRNA